MQMKPKLNSSVSVVKISDQILEFFKTNTRQQVRIKVPNDDILQIVCSLDGTKELEVIAAENNVDVASLASLLDYLSARGILDSVTPSSDFYDYDRFRRVIHFLSEYASSHENLVHMWNSLRNSRVLIVGLGAVGTWVACNLVQSGVKTLIVMDPDRVDISNLHRQVGYSEKTIGQLKADALEAYLHEMASDITVIKDYHYLDENSLHVFDNQQIDLVVNCADKPNVDLTSNWIGEYCMERGIPHIVGGGYNMHLSLIGQTILPGRSA